MTPKRPAPPMYGRVQRKVAPPVRRAVVQPAPSDPVPPQVTPVAAPPASPAAPPVVEKAAEKKAPKKPPATKKEPVKKEPVAEKKAPKKPAAETKAPKKEPAKKKPKWNEDMTQKELYLIAKKAGLDVKSRDWKHEILAALKKAGI